MADGKSIDDIANEAKVPDAGKKESAEEKKLQDAYMQAYKKSKPSGLSKLVGLGLGAAATYFLAPVLGAFGPVAGIASTISSYLGVASQYVTYGLAALAGGATLYSIPTSMSRISKANKYMQQQMAGPEKKDYKGPGAPPGTAPAKP